MKHSLLALILLIPTGQAAQQRGPVRHVEPVSGVWVSPDHGPSTPGWQVSRFDRVQDAVDAVDPDGFVKVLPGTYAENVVVDKRITLSGAGRDVTVINGGFDQDALRVEADGVLVEGLTLECTNNAFLGPAGLRLFSDGNTIRNNGFETCGYGLYVGSPATGNLVEGNRTSSNYRGLYVYSSGNTVRSNEISGDTIGIEILPGVTRTVVTDNLGSSNQWAILLDGSSSGNFVSGNQLGEGIYLEGTTGNTIANNTVTGPSSGGIDLFLANGNTIVDNVLVDVTNGGIRLFASDCNDITSNELEGCRDGILLEDSQSTTITDNTLDSAGITIHGLLPEEWNSHTITGNEVLGAPIEYYRSIYSPFTVPSGTGQVIAVDCLDILVENQDFGPVEAVQTGFCTFVTVQGCTVQSGPEYALSMTESQVIEIAENDFGAGIFVYASDCEIRDNVLRGDGPSSRAYGGIIVPGPFVSSNTITRNTVTGFRSDGIFASHQANLTVEDNLVHRCGGRGMRFYEIEGLVAGNVVNGNQGGIVVGSSVSAAPGIEFRDNLISGNGPVGIEAGRFDLVAGNVLVGHDDGLILNGDAMVVDNHIAGNVTGIDAQSSTGSTLHHNALANGSNAHDAGANTWSDGPAGGNYWHDYAGVDLDLDGIGDTPHPIPPSGSDGLPLMEPPGDLLLWADGYALGYPTGGTIDFDLHAGVAQAGRPYLLLGSSTGRDPGLVLPGGAVLPLVWDAFTDDVVANLNTSKYAGFAGTLNGQGEATAQFVSGPIPPQLAGTTLYFAYLLQTPFDVVSVAINVDLGD